MHVIREIINAYKISGANPHCGKLRYTRTEEVNIKFIPGEINSDGVDWILTVS
jgi:hypothetical protein